MAVGIAGISVSMPVGIAVTLASTNAVPVRIPAASTIAASTAGAGTAATTRTATPAAATPALSQRGTRGRDHDSVGEHEDSIGCHPIPPSGLNRPPIESVSEATARDGKASSSKHPICQRTARA